MKTTINMLEDVADSNVHGNPTEENQYGPPQIPPDIGIKNDTGNKCNKRIR
jgi:hypothetical protein